ncbi:hypothetical protein HanXRQr2_Chr12g0538021 [Helianthus annuus]|uniref:Uncharacterized protein n=1 Tax=Helianthus annuus TaxID=4232 RepID=A0A251T2A3_HELAN|nr:hypothetical protein HanXRQr2_Chr12g0538021 [Helianthus annuus]KAJ0862409.1 hypothetical protein HanPSC8_Chr12g0517841 [Helianthus annuus]
MYKVYLGYFTTTCLNFNVVCTVSLYLYACLLLRVSQRQSFILFVRHVAANGSCRIYS